MFAKVYKVCVKDNLLFFYIFECITPFTKNWLSCKFVSECVQIAWGSLIYLHMIVLLSQKQCRVKEHINTMFWYKLFTCVCRLPTFVTQCVCGRSSKTLIISSNGTRFILYKSICSLLSWNFCMSYFHCLGFEEIEWAHWL